jgi:hypothetical protein
MKDKASQDVQMALHSKRVYLKKQGMGNWPNRSVGLDETEEMEETLLRNLNPQSVSSLLFGSIQLFNGVEG